MRKKKLLIILIMFLIISIIIPSYIFASDSDIDTVISGMSSVATMDKGGGNLQKVFNAFIKIIQVAGTGVSLIVVTILGIKYMLAGTQEKADIKKSAIPIIIGCVLLFTAVNIVSIISKTATSANLTS